MTKPGVAYPKVREPQRAQSSFRFEVTEDLIPPEHPARLLWNVLGQFDLSPFLARAKSAQGAAGRSALSPRMKLTLWLYGIADGIGSARRPITPAPTSSETRSPLRSRTAHARC